MIASFEDLRLGICLLIDCLNFSTFLISLGATIEKVFPVGFWFSRNDKSLIHSCSSCTVSNSSAENDRRIPVESPTNAPFIESNSRTTRSFQWRAPKSTRWLITDAAPGLSDTALSDIIQNHDLIIVPVLPSDIDIRASARFIGDILLTQTMRRARRPIAVVANRVKQHTNAWQGLQRFMLSLNIPFPATLRDTQHYVKAYSEGRGISDYPQKNYERDRNDWDLLLRWLDAQESSQPCFIDKDKSLTSISLSNAS